MSDDPGDKVPIDDSNDETPIEDSSDEATAHETGHPFRGKSSSDRRGGEQFQATVKTWATAISALATVVGTIVMVATFYTQSHGDHPAPPNTPASSAVADQRQ
ncbi:hypothetical protein [Streptomyces sp. NPDC058084]|uniref:hypothetical protein n=1 Tax=Streptomyces sp. NPDC058084 TaxID=3346333 RepID=UPI0036ED03BA